MLTVAQIKDWVAKEYGAATQEVHNFVAWIEQKDNQIASAKATLEANGYTVTLNTAAPVVPPAA